MIAAKLPDEMQATDPEGEQVAADRQEDQRGEDPGRFPVAGLGRDDRSRESGREHAALTPQHRFEAAPSPSALRHVAPKTFSPNLRQSRRPIDCHAVGTSRPACESPPFPRLLGSYFANELGDIDRRDRSGHPRLRRDRRPAGDDRTARRGAVPARVRLSRARRAARPAGGRAHPRGALRRRGAVFRRRSRRWPRTSRSSLVLAARAARRDPRADRPRPHARRDRRDARHREPAARGQRAGQRRRSRVADDRRRRRRRAFWSAQSDVRTALLIDAASFALVARADADLPRPADRRPRSASPSSRASARDSASSGAARRCAACSACQALALVLFTLIVPIEVIYAKETLDAGDVGLGVLIAAWGGGMVLGSARRSSARRPAAADRARPGRHGTGRRRLPRDGLRPRPACLPPPSPWSAGSATALSAWPS